MNAFIQERQGHNENCLRVEVSRRTQSVVIYLAFEGSGLFSLERTQYTFLEVLLAVILEG